MSDVKDLVVYGLETLLGYAKYLEDNNSLTYDLLRQRVETFKKSESVEKL
jgi:hypothetical protein